MSRQKNQILIFNDSELELIKAIFSENEEAIYAIRKVLLQFELSQEDKTLIKSIMTPELFNILKKRIFPEISNDMPLGQIGDIYQTLTQQMAGRNASEMRLLFDAKQLEIDYLEQQFEQLKDVEKIVSTKYILDDMRKIKGKNYEQIYVDTTARNFILGFIDPMLIMIKNIAGQKTETIEETKKRITRNSNQ